MKAHDGSLRLALPHYNGAYRFRFHLPPIEGEPAAPDLTATEDLPDGECAYLARWIAARVPRYLLGHRVPDPLCMDETPESTLVLLHYPWSRTDNWGKASRQYRALTEQHHRTALAELAARDERVGPRDSAYGKQYLDHVTLAEAAYIFGVSQDTIRNWRDETRAELKGTRPGRRRK